MGSVVINSFGDAFTRFFNLQLLERAATVIAIIVAGYLLVTVVLLFFRRLAKKRMNPRAASIVEKAVKYVGVVVVFVNAAEIAGINLTAALGAAGIAGIALGFAAQTSVSNIISGLFLFSEKTFELGDVLQIENMTGTIESVDLLSIKIRTFDNRLVRVPNESVIKSRIVNVTRWPERRLDVSLTLPLGVDPAEVEKLLRNAATSIPAALSEPKPSFSLSAMDPNGMQFAFGVWVNKKEYYSFKADLLYAILAAFEAVGLTPTLRIASIWDFPDGP
jgi:small-conductance mechanosensitive channel